MGVATSARALVAGVLADLGPATGGWCVVDVAPAPDVVGQPRAGRTAATHLLVTVGGPDGSFQVYATDCTEQAEADVATAEQVQDYVIELLGGAAVPPCPGHSHPLQPRVVDEEPMWVCPSEPSRHRAPLGRTQ